LSLSGFDLVLLVWIQKARDEPSRPQPIAGMPKVYNIGPASPNDPSELKIPTPTRIHPQRMLGQSAALPKITPGQDGEVYPDSAIAERKAAKLNPKPKSAKATPQITVLSKMTLFTVLLRCGLSE
jgi:hypothetical protein